MVCLKLTANFSRLSVYSEAGELIAKLIFLREERITTQEKPAIANNRF